MSADKSEVPTTTQPDGTSIGGQTVTVKVPKMDLGQINRGEWSSSMTDCLEDLPVCCFGCFCPCLLLWQNAKNLGEESPLLYCLGWFLCPTMVALRVKARSKFNIKDDIMTDVINSGCCCWGLLSNCQVASEIKNREQK